MSERAVESLPASYFAKLYAADADPWNFASSDYEQLKYAATMAALPRPLYRRGFEMGCSIGILTEQLAERCGSLLAVDVVDRALAAARQRCRHHRHVTFARMRLPAEPPEGSFDLIMLSEVIYYLDVVDLSALALWIDRALEPEGDLVLVHWVRATDYPLSGDDAVGALLRRLRAGYRALALRRTGSYRLDVLRRLG